MDVFGCVSELRKQRLLMVQTPVSNARDHSDNHDVLILVLLVIIFKLRLYSTFINFIFARYFFQDQYVFVYEALLENVKEGGTIIPAAQFDEAFAKLQQRGGKQLVKQFVLLSKFDPQQPADSLKTALMEDNVHKNRDASLAAGMSISTVNSVNFDT